MCSDTVSRSAIFCAAMTAVEWFKTEAAVDIFNVVKLLRHQKPGAVLTVVRKKKGHIIDLSTKNLHYTVLLSYYAKIMS